MFNFNNQDIDVAFNVDSKLQALIKGSDLDFTGYVINSEGTIVHESTFNFESVFPPSAEILLDAYLLSVKQSIYIYEAIAIIKQDNKEVANNV